MKNLEAFNLSEVLISLVVIGVVAALTIPQFVQKYTERAMVVKLKKSYAALQNAYQMAQAEYGEKFTDDADWSNGTNISFYLGEKLAPYLDIVHTCTQRDNFCYGTKGPQGEAGTYYTKIPKGGYTAMRAANLVSFVLKDGSLIRFLVSPNRKAKIVEIMIDVNGPKGPNWYGFDTFFFNINAYQEYKDNRIVPYDAGKTSSREGCRLNSTHSKYCAAWVLKNGNLDYLHCDLDWATQTKCN